MRHGFRFYYDQGLQHEALVHVDRSGLQPHLHGQGGRRRHCQHHCGYRPQQDPPPNFEIVLPNDQARACLPTRGPGERLRHEGLRF